MLSWVFIPNFDGKRKKIGPSYLFAYLFVSNLYHMSSILEMRSKCCVVLLGSGIQNLKNINLVKSVHDNTTAELYASLSIQYGDLWGCVISFTSLCSMTENSCPGCRHLWITAFIPDLSLERTSIYFPYCHAEMLQTTIIRLRTSLLYFPTGHDYIGIFYLLFVIHKIKQQEGTIHDIFQQFIQQCHGHVLRRCAASSDVR